MEKTQKTINGSLNSTEVIEDITSSEIVTGVADQERFQSLTNELRCMVCQNQTIAESNAGLAVDLKKQVAKQINEGKTDDQILNFMEERYGEFVLYNPPVSLENSLLWLTPFVVLIIAVLILISALKRQNKSND
jgi:cytochrome c-type biogenesis protein CcmH